MKILSKPQPPSISSKFLQQIPDHRTLLFQLLQHQVLLPSEQILHNIQLTQRLEHEARAEVQNRNREEADDSH